jgi:hypothetical protein
LALRLRQKKIAARMIRATETTGTTTATAILPLSERPPELDASLALDRDGESVAVDVAPEEPVEEAADSVWVWVITITVDWPLLFVDVEVVTLSEVVECEEVDVGSGLEEDDDEVVEDEEVVVECVVVVGAVVEDSFEVVVDGWAVVEGDSLEESLEVVVAVSLEVVVGSELGDGEADAASAPVVVSAAVAWLALPCGLLLGAGAGALLLMTDDIFTRSCRGAFLEIEVDQDESICRVDGL